MWLRDAARQEKLPSIDDLDDPKYFPYRWGQAVWAYIGGRWGDDVIGDILATAAAAGDVNVALNKVLGVTHRRNYPPTGRPQSAKPTSPCWRRRRCRVSWDGW